MVNEWKTILADGTELPDCECGYADKMLWCYDKNMSFVDAFQTFSNPEKTKRITFVHGKLANVFIGFTTLNVVKQSEFTVDVRLVGENTEVIIDQPIVDETPENSGENTDLT